MTEAPSIVWFRRDLRVGDNPALSAAFAARRPVVALYVRDEDRFFAPGGAQKWFLHHALRSLERNLAALGAPLAFRSGREAATVLSFAAEIGAAAIFWNRRYDAESIETDRAVKEASECKGVSVHSFNGALLREPWEIKTKAGGPYRVFKPFWNSLRAAGPGRTEIMTPIAAPSPHIVGGGDDELDNWEFLPTGANWAKEFSLYWSPGENGARRALDRFLAAAARNYGARRDRPDIEGTSRLSPYLAVGAISAVSVWNAIAQAVAASAIPENEGMKFLSELAWREFSYHLLYHNPAMPTEPLRAEYSRFAWRKDERAFAAWTKGQTGVPIVDAGMRQLWRTGWMHNRVRMIVASYLVKNLLMDWRCGERWFWDTLVDADPANNSASWQWVAGCGADAAPYFRIFNPMRQGARFDPDGDYVRRFAPEYAAPPNEPLLMSRCGEGTLAPTPPLVDLNRSRKRALAAFAEMMSRHSPVETPGSDD